MKEKKLKWHKIADSPDEIQFNENHLAEIKVHEKKVCLIQTMNAIRACAAKCPHAGGDMVEGFLDRETNIVCPVHRYIFNLNSGRDLNNEGYYLKIYPVEIKQDGVFLGMEEGGIFGWLR